MQCTEFLRRLEANGPEAHARLRAAYGGDPGPERLRTWVRAARRFLMDWGDREVHAFRAPGRIALNPHCEHQGAWVPYGTHRREMICLAAARADDTVTLTNLDPSHTSPLSFGLREEVAVAPVAWRRGWIEYLENREVAQRREALADPKERRHRRTGSINFIKAAALRLAVERAVPPRGADLVIAGDIPVGVGQSSSSALVVVGALAFSRLWDLDLDPARLTQLCGEAEWYVGTRGGAGDHAAMLLGSAEGLTGIRFVPPVTVRETRPMVLPPGYQILIANSSHKAIKNKEQRLLFNAGIFAYRFALLYLREAVAKRRHDLGLGVDPEEVRFLADISLERFQLPTIYQLLLTVPEAVSPRELMMRYPDSYEPSALACFGTADCDQLPNSIPIRGAAMYGLGRVDRGLAMYGLCARGDEVAMTEFGRLMYITHDGDRVSQYHLEKAQHALYSSNRESVSDARVEALLAASLESASGEARDAIQLRRQSGFYGASVPELDCIVDVVSRLPDVLGAGLMGAGGGGCVLILAREGEEVCARVTAELTQHYYEPLGKRTDVERWEPVAEAGEMGDVTPSRRPTPRIAIPR
jgi:N-acetylgalactosamine kinase